MATRSTAVRMRRAGMPSERASSAEVRSLSTTAWTPCQSPFAPRTTGMPPPPPAMTTVPAWSRASMTRRLMIARGSGEATQWRQPRPASSVMRQPFASSAFASSAEKKGPMGLDGERIAGSSGSTSTCVHAGRLPFEPGTAQGVLQRLHEQVPDTSLAVGDANVEPHWRHLLLGQHHAEQDLADHRAVSMGNQQPVLRPDQGDERPGRGVGDHFLLLGGAADVLRMGGVTAYRDEERIRDGHAQPPRYAARAASTPAPRDSLCFSWERIASSAPRVLRTASARALYPMVPMRQMRPCSGPKEVPISMLKSSRSARRTFSPSTPGGICTPVTYAILWRWSPKSLSPIAWRPAVS